MGDLSIGNNKIKGKLKIIPTTDDRRSVFLCFYDTFGLCENPPLNGRSARLIEKWFMAEKMGEKSWFVQSEKHYYEEHHTYYKNIRLLGHEYPVLDYKQALPFLIMLPNAVFKG